MGHRPDVIANPTRRRTMSAEPHIPAEPAFSFAFQPIVDTVAREVVAWEALIRGMWDEPAWQVLNQVSPLHFHLFDQTARSAAIALAGRLGIDRPLHLNFLPQSLASYPKSLLTTLEAAHEAGLPIGRIVLEAPEAELVEDRAHFAGLLKEYRKLGLRLAIDDFGAAWADLNILADLQPDQIKLDMRLIRSIERPGTRQAIVRAIRLACFELNIDVIAEGVETLAEYTWLADQNIRHFQGYLFARPAFEAFPPAHFPQTAEEAATSARPVASSRPQPARSKKRA
jgi:EAL domain-containing protein (putative c-di-GMP-specific phosphodiesterase class I)